MSPFEVDLGASCRPDRRGRPAVRARPRRARAGSDRPSAHARSSLLRLSRVVPSSEANTLWRTASGTRVPGGQGVSPHLPRSSSALARRPGRLRSMRSSSSSLVRLSRSDIIASSRTATIGLRSRNGRKSRWRRTSISQGSSAVASALRGLLSRMAISPMISPSPSTASTASRPSGPAALTFTRPAAISIMLSPASPLRKITSPAPWRRAITKPSTCSSSSAGEEAQDGMAGEQQAPTAAICCLAGRNKGFKAHVPA
jgi:hypothetical protein